jgi:hypothetical protein
MRTTYKVKVSKEINDFNILALQQEGLDFHKGYAYGTGEDFENQLDKSDGFLRTLAQKFVEGDYLAVGAA